MKRHLNSMLTAAALFASLCLFSVPAAAQRGGGAPEPAGCPAPPDWYVQRQAAQAGARGGGGAGGGRAAAPAAGAPGAAAAGGGGGRGAGGGGGRGGGGRGGGAAAAQPPVPRIPNEPAYGVQAGKPDFGGLAKGVWNVPYIVNIQTDAHDENGCRFIQVPFKPAAKTLWEERYLKNDMKDDPEGFCLPPGIPRMMYTPYPAQIYQMPDRIVMVYEGAAHVWRLIWMDGRPLPKSIDDINPDFLGYSVGHWDGDTLVVESMGFNTETWLDASGHPHGENMRVTEKYTRTSFNNIKLEATINDPEYYTKPFTIVTGITWNANTRGPWTLRGGELVEYICQENNRDLQHLGAERGK
ncbi:MAG TPA: hypothetical protein VGN17_14745 [Bryobacteraceae bacterium]